MVVFLSHPQFDLLGRQLINKIQHLKQKAGDTVQKHMTLTRSAEMLTLTKTGFQCILRPHSFHQPITGVHTDTETLPHSFYVNSALFPRPQSLGIPLACVIFPCFPLELHETKRHIQIKYEFSKRNTIFL